MTNNKDNMKEKAGFPSLVDVIEHISGKESSEVIFDNNKKTLPEFIDSYAPTPEESRLLHSRLITLFSSRYETINFQMGSLPSVTYIRKNGPSAIVTGKKLAFASTTIKTSYVRSDVKNLI